jgi:DNA-binding LacI/PurR family transcriptional regulator/DNA-binding transcriptional regulator YhcF (GntR family)
MGSHSFSHLTTNECWYTLVNVSGTEVYRKAYLLSNFSLKFELDQSRPEALYAQIRDQLKAHIASEQSPENTRLPVARALAEMAGVSLRTAHRALQELVKEGICYKKDRKGIYVGSPIPHHDGVRRKACCIHRVGGVSNFDEDVVSMHMYNGIHRRTRIDQVDTIILSALAENDLSFYLQNPDMEMLGVIILGFETFKDGETLARKFPNVPFIFLNYHIQGFDKTPDNMHGIFNGDFAGAYQATEWLISRGHRNIAALALDIDDENYRQRIRGYRKALHTNAIMAQQDSVCLAPLEDGRTHEDIGSALAQHVLEHAPTTTAIFCVNDRVAVGASKYLEKIDRADDIEVVGYDNVLPYLSKNNYFSTVHVDFEGMGELAVERLSAQHGDFPKALHLTPKMIIRDSALMITGSR